MTLDEKVAQLETVERLIRRGAYTGPLNITWVGIGGDCWCMSRPIHSNTPKLAISKAARLSHNLRVVSMTRSVEDASHVAQGSPQAP